MDYIPLGYVSDDPHSWPPFTPKILEGVEFSKFGPPFTKKYGNSDRSSFFAEGYDPLQSLKFFWQKFDHYIAQTSEAQTESNFANVITTDVRKHVPPLNVAPSSEHIVKPTHDWLSVATLVLRTAKYCRNALRRTTAVWRQTYRTSRIFAVQLSAKSDASYNGCNSRPKVSSQKCQITSR